MAGDVRCWYWLMYNPLEEAMNEVHGSNQKMKEANNIMDRLPL